MNIQRGREEKRREEKRREEKRRPHTLMNGSLLEVSPPFSPRHLLTGRILYQCPELRPSIAHKDVAIKGFFEWEDVPWVPEVQIGAGMFYQGGPGARKSRFGKKVKRKGYGSA
jgi:hypothetical protein